MISNNKVINKMYIEIILEDINCILKLSGEFKFHLNQILLDIIK